jgi:hypothetical protein
MQPLEVELGVMTDDGGERAEAPVVHVRRGARDVAQRRHAELAEVAVLERHVANRGRRSRRRIVVERTEEVVTARLHAADALVPSRVDAPRGDEERDAGVVELAVGECRSEVADVAAPLPHEERGAPAGGGRVACRGGGIAARERIAKLVERRAPGDERLLIRGERLGGVDRDVLVVGPGRRAERRAVLLAQTGIVADKPRDMGEARAHLPRLDQRAQALRPGSAAPSQPYQRASRRLASAMVLGRRCDSRGSRPSVGETRCGWWQVAQETPPTRTGADRRTGFGRMPRPRVAETRFDGSLPAATGHGRGRRLPPLGQRRIGGAQRASPGIRPDTRRPSA